MSIWLCVGSKHAAKINLEKGIVPHAAPVGIAEDQRFKRAGCVLRKDRFDLFHGLLDIAMQDGSKHTTFVLGYIVLLLGLVGKLKHFIALFLIEEAK